MNEQERLQKTLTYSGLNPTTRKAVENRLAELNKSTPAKTYDYVITGPRIPGPTSPGIQPTPTKGSTQPPRSIPGTTPPTITTSYIGKGGDTIVPTSKPRDPNLSDSPASARALPIEETISQTKYTPPPTPPSMTTGEYVQDISQRRDEIRTALQTAKTTPPNIIGSKLSSAEKMITTASYGLYVKELEQADAAAQKNLNRISGEVKQWHPDTKIYRTARGYDIQFPYAGAEKYFTYKELLDPSMQKDIGGHARSFGLHFSASLTAEDPFGLTSSYYRSIGEDQKALDAKIKAIHGVTQKSFFEHYISMPSTQIGFAISGGGLLGSAQKAGYLTGTAARTALTGAGVAGVSYASVPIVQDLKSGKIGEAIGKGATLGLAITGGYASYKSAITSKPNLPKFDIKHYKMPGKPEVLTAQKYTTLFGKDIHYGKTTYGLKPDSMLPFKTPPKSNIPSGIKTPTSIQNIKMATGKDVLTYTFGGKTHIDPVLPYTTAWQPQTGMRFLPSTKVWPKPLPHPRAYETHFFVVVGTPPPAVTMKPSLIKIKPFKPFKKTTFDVIKKDSTMPSSGGQIQRSGQITLQQPLLKTEKLAVPEQLLKRVTKYKTIQQTKQKTVSKTGTLLKPKSKLKFKPVISNVPVQQTQSTQMKDSLLSPIVTSKQRKQFDKYIATVSDTKQDFTPLTITDVIPGTVSDLKRATDNRYVYPAIPKLTTPYPKTKRYKHPNVFEIPYKQTPKTNITPFGIGFPRTDEGSKKKKKQQNYMEYVKGYRYRKWKTPTVAMLLGTSKKKRKKLKIDIPGFSF